MFDAKNCHFLPQETQFTAFLLQMTRESQRVLRTKFWVKSACEDAPQVVLACWVVFRFSPVMRMNTIVTPLLSPFLNQLNPNFY